MKHALLLACLLCCSSRIIAQSAAQPARPSVSFGVDAPFRLDWAETPKLHKLHDSLRKFSAAIISDRRQNHYKQDGTNLTVQRTVHRIVRLYDAKGVESFNTLTLQIADGNSMERLKARTILPDGRVIKVDNDKIKTTKGENGARQFLVAFEGVEQGAEIEYLYTEKRSLSVFGSEQLQWTIPVLHTEIFFVMPDRLKFEFRGYNGYPSPGKDSIVSGQRVYRVAFGPVPPLEEEDYSSYQASLMRMDYKLAYLSEKETTRMLTWDDMARQIYEGFSLYTPKEERAAKRYLRSIDVHHEEPEVERVRKIENALKTGIVINDGLDGEVYNDFDMLVEKKMTTEKGFTRFLAACLGAAGVAHQVGLTSNFSEHVVDETFENWAALDHYVIYLTGLKGYIDPVANGTRYPVLPSTIIYNKGIFSEIVTKGSGETARARIRTIPALPMEASSSNIEADIEFAGEDLSPRIHFRHLFSGYASLGLRSMFAAVTADKTKDLVTQFVSVAEKPEDISSYTVENKGMAHFGTGKPLVVDARTVSPHLMEKAGPKYLFRLGEVIGRQSEMYNEHNRKLPIQMDYPHTLIRRLNITIPEGYTVKNPEAVRFNVTHTRDKSGPGIGFVSDYSMKGNVMEITVKEYYGEVHFPVSDYEKFRRVINAAADFNKVVLVLQRKQ